MSASPETDAHETRNISYNNAGFVPAEFARKLERERDEARDIAKAARTVIEDLLGGKEDLKAKLEAENKMVIYLGEVQLAQADVLYKLQSESATLSAKLETCEGALKCAAREIVEVNHEKEELSAKLEEWKKVAVDVLQILDGWHSDGTCWSQWDESVRIRIIEALAKEETKS